MPLSKNQNHLISALLEELLLTPDGVNPTRFKLRHEEEIGELEKLESLQLIRRNNQNKYEIPLSTVLALEGEALPAEGLISDCRRLFDAIKNNFRRDPEKNVPLSELATQADIPLARVYASLPFISQAPIWGHRSNDLNSPTATIRGSEEILKYKTFDNLATLLRQWAESALKPPQSISEPAWRARLPSILNPGQSSPKSSSPSMISESLARFKKDHSERRTAFVMMQFGQTSAHSEIFEAIRTALAVHDIVALRADSKQYHDDLFPNVLTYIYGCTFGIAVFERIEQDTFNPNVSLEVGYMFGLEKRVCLLKDRTLKTLHTDLVGKLYRQFDPLHAAATIPNEVHAWLRDKEL
jgi:hypothetical protein